MWLNIKPDCLNMQFKRSGKYDRYQASITSTGK